MMHLITYCTNEMMSEIFQAKYQFVFGDYAQLALAVGIIIELALIGQRDKNRRNFRPEGVNRLALMLWFAAALTGLDFLRGFAVIEVPRLSNFTPVYRPEAHWYLCRAIVSTVALVAFDFLEKFVRSEIKGTQLRSNDTLGSQIARESVAQQRSAV